MAKREVLSKYNLGLRKLSVMVKDLYIEPVIASKIKHLSLRRRNILLC